MRASFLCALLCATACGRSTPYRFEGFDDPLDGGADAGLDGGTDAGFVPCTPGHPVLTHARPEVMFVVDRSRSMNDRFGTTTRWRALTLGLAATLPPTDTGMDIGGLIFPITGSANTCAVPSMLDLTPGPTNGVLLVAKMASTLPNGGTPTADAIDVAGKALQAIRAAGTARAMVLATDGAPDCNSDLNPSTCACVGTRPCSATRCLDDTRTIDRIKRFADQGVPTWVIGITDEGDMQLTSVLEKMAIAGGRPQTGAATSYYGVTSQTELEAALVDIRNRVGACTFLSTSVPDVDDDMTLTLDGVTVPRTEWTFVDRGNGELELLGDACARAAANVKAPLEATVACNGP